MAKKFLDSAGLTYFINKIVYGITSPKFSTGSTYTVGDFVIYTGQLYRCTTAVTVAGAWSASKWVQTTVKGEIKALNTNLGGTTFSVTANGAYVHYTPTGGADPVVKKLGSQDFNFKLYVSGITSGQDPSITKSASITLDVTDYKTVRADYTFTVDGTSHPANTNVDVSNLTGNHSIGFSYISVTPYDKTVSFLLYI